MAINQITTANTFSQWVEATRALIATANGLTNGVQAGQAFTMNTAVVIDGFGASLDVKTSATVNQLTANSINIGATPLGTFSIVNIANSTQAEVIANGLNSTIRFQGGYGVVINTSPANDTIYFSVPQNYAIGYTGSAGAAGATGFTGSAGSAGSAGATGFTGSRGFTGSAGSAGGTGFTGSIGVQGFTGSIGIQGFTGSIGLTGPQGAGYLGIPQNAQTTQYTLVIGDAGKHISTTSNVIVPNSVFSVGDAVSVFNNSAAVIRLTQGTGTTIRLAGTNQTGSRNVANYGLVSIICVGANTFVASGVGLY